MTPQKVNRRQFLNSAAVASLACRSLRAQRHQPNILFILLDDLGYGDVGCYGQEKIQTPNIDHLATEGIRYTDCYAGGAVCAPSRGVLMTGLDTGHATVRSNAWTMSLLPDPGDRTVAELLQNAGYETGLFGKWGLGDAGSVSTPDKKGFDDYYGYLHQIHAHDYYTTFLWHNGKKDILTGNLNGKRQQYSADVIFNHSLQFLKRQKKGKPFFLYAPYTLPHPTYEVPSTEPYSNRNWPDFAKIYAAMVTHADTQIGILLKALKESGLEDNTVVFFASDNGADNAKKIAFFRSNGPLRGHKAQLYEGGIRIPMIVRWPGVTKPGTVSSIPWAFCDFLPTAADIAGVQAPKKNDGMKIDGISMAPSFRSSATTEQGKPRMLYWEFYNFDPVHKDLRKNSLSQAARWGDWKAIRVKPGAALELYNLRTDLSETSNVAVKHPEIMSKLEAFINESHTEPRPQNTGNKEFVR